MNSRADLRRIAAEYVIGTLDAAERADWHARMAEDAEVAALVALWEQRLAPLNELSAPARPPEGLFDRILSGLPPLPAEVETPAQVPDATQPDGDPAPDTPVEEADSASQPAVEPPADATAPVAPVDGDAEAVGEGTEEETVPPTPPESVTEPARGDGEKVIPSPAAQEEAPVPDSVADEAAVPEGGAAPETADTPTAPGSPGREPEAVNEAPGEPAPSAPAGEETPVADRAVPPPASVVRPAPEPEEAPAANPWRRASGVLMLALLVGGGAFAYRELHHRPVPPPSEPPKQAEAAPEPPPPAPVPPPSVPESFAVLGPQPVPAIGFAFDHQAGTVSVLKMATPPPAGMKYHLWLVTDLDGPRHIAGFDAPGTYPSDLLQDVNAATLAGALLMVTEEPDGPPPSAPSAAPAFSGMAVRR